MPVVAFTPLPINGTSRYQLLHLSCHPAPDGSLPAFAWGDVARMGGATPIRPITGRLSLSPPSFTRNPIGLPCGSLSPKGRTTGLPRSARVPAWVRSLFYTGGAPSAIDDA